MTDANIPDYYALFDVNPRCDTKVLESAYRHFAKIYHPDHPETADIDRFSRITEAYRVLRDPVRRAEYDLSYFVRNGVSGTSLPASIDIEVDKSIPQSDAEVQEKILFSLYKRRRENASDAGVVAWLIQEMFECSDDSFEFHVWYLKSKGLIEVTEQGKLAATLQGVDHVISSSRGSDGGKLLTSGNAL